MARSFNGSSDKITIGTGFTIPADNLSWFAWLYPTTLQLGGILGGATNNGLSLDLFATGQISIVKTSIQQNWTSTGTALSTNAWFAVGADANTGGSSAHVYRNGVSQSMLQNNAWSSSTAHALIGDTNTAATFFKGRLAHVACWNVVLTAGEQLSLSQGALPFQIRPTALIGYWPLDGLQSPEPDLSGFANNGTLTGTALADGPPAMMLTPRWPQTTETAAGPPPSSVVYRRTLSPIGTRAGTRQVESWE